jgi:hypothetical protein
MEASLDRYARSGGVIPARPFYIWREFLIRHEAETLYSGEAYEYCWTCTEKFLVRVRPLLPKAQWEDHYISSAELHHEDMCK